MTFPNGMPRLATLQQLTGYVGIEVFNASGFGGMGSAYATDKWDMLLSQGRRLWGFASDDYHQRTDAQRGWIMAFVKQRSREAVLDALRRGCFYASALGSAPPGPHKEPSDDQNDLVMTGN